MRAYILRILFLIYWICLIPYSLYSSENNNIITNLNFKHISTNDGLPNDEVQKVFQDRDGFIWFATRYGFCKYDGYSITTFKSDLNTPEVLTNNNIICLTDDADRNIWIGTLEGLNVYNKETGVISKCNYPGINDNLVSCLLVTHDNTLWVGTDFGLFRYNRESDEMILYAGERTGNVLSTSSIKSLIEDSDGDIWIGTWSSGLYRYETRTNRFYDYPIFNSKNSAHVIFEDSRQNIWIGGWGEGLFLLENPKDMSAFSWRRFHNTNSVSSLSDNMVYDICEDINTNSLWVGTRSGLSIMKMESPGEFISYKSINSTHYVPFSEANSIIRDNSGKMWIGTIGRGVYMTDTQRLMFNLYRFNSENESLPTTAVRSLLLDDEDNVWLSIGTYGIAKYNRITGEYNNYSSIPEFSEIKSMSTIYATLNRKYVNELWFGAYDGGLFVYEKGKKVRFYNTENSDFIIHPCVTALHEDVKGNCWIGTRFGLGVRKDDGTGHIFYNIIAEGRDISQSYVREIKEDEHKNYIWLATANNGIIKISGDIASPESLEYTNYSACNGGIKTNSILTLQRDSKGRLWAGTEGYGLFLYNKHEDAFEEKNTHYNLLCDMVGSIEEDSQGNLWLGTNRGLMRLTISEDAASASLQAYTTADGLQDNFFIPRSSLVKDGEMFFGGYNGYNSFFADSISDNTPKSPFFITDIKIFNRSLSSYEENIRKNISTKTSPYTDKITLPYKYNNFNIEFASLTYKNPELNKYSYKLDGFDKEWQYTDNDRHFAYYNNLKSGTYTFHLRATNENGVWSEHIRKLSVTILPPLWATWWAYLIYIILTAIIIYIVFNIAKNRIMLKNSLQLQKMEQIKAEELNNAKLQFFTNVTHELMTPLTIISATVDELKMQEPQHARLYPVITTNIQRLLRLLQQILELRKAETGNLKLRVSHGDIAAFVKSKAEAFEPLIKKHKLHFSIICDPESISGYFDIDKLDKILYNLLSNATKYNNEGGFIQINLSYAKDKDHILITVKDNGNGISEESQKTIFDRFNEGDYRKFNTIGTGIGLSLSKDLVELHGGTISIDSEPGKGTTFFITIPVKRSYFKEIEIDDDIVHQSKYESAPEAKLPELLHTNEQNKQTILVLEDNEELLSLMVTLLSREYNVLTGKSGNDGIEVMESEDIDLVISDIMMPDTDGIEFCKLVKNKFEFSHIPIILLTAKNNEEDRTEAYESGADGFISKPFNLAVLHARIKNLLKTKKRVAREFKHQLVFEASCLNYTSLDEEFMQKAIDCVNDNLNDPEFDQVRFIEEMRTSKSTLYRKLKSLTGLNTSAFIRNIRLKAAVDIMSKKKNIRISELAYAVGFNDPKYFSSCFKKEFGILPSEYAEQYLPEQVDNAPPL